MKYNYKKLSLNNYNTLALSTINSKNRCNQRGSVIIDGTLALFVFVIIFLFTLYFYEYIETKHELQVKTGQIMRQMLLENGRECYMPVDYEIKYPVNLQYNIRKFIGSSQAQVDVIKIGFTGSCPGHGLSRFDSSQERRPRLPNGSYIGDW